MYEKYNKITIINGFESRSNVIKKEDWFTIPNILSYVRVALIPIYISMYINAEVVTDYYCAAGILLLSGITDALDGIIARKTSQITDLGKLLDPIADKLTQVAVIAVMFVERPYVLPLLILFILKELFLLINNIILYRKDEFMDGSMWFGKVATVVFYVCTFLLVVFPYLGQRESMPLIIITAGFQIIALIGYANWFVKRFKALK